MAAGCDQARQGVPVPRGVSGESEDVEQLVALAGDRLRPFTNCQLDLKHTGLGS